MNQQLKKEIEDYVSDWHWDDLSEIYAFEMGKFMFSFIEFLRSQNVSERTIYKHKENAYLIGMFDMQYHFVEGYEFHPQDLEDGPSLTDVFKRKVSDSPYAIQSYESTWRKLDKYVKSETYKPFLEKIEKELKEG